MDPTESDIDRSSLKDEVRRFSDAVRVVYSRYRKYKYDIICTSL
jgi:hypothetical protein